MKTRQLTVAGGEDGADLLTFLARSLGVSRKKAKRRLDDRNVLVNGRRIWMAHHLLRAGDRVTCVESGPSTPPAAPVPLYEDEDYLIVNKPAGRLSNGPDSVESRLRAQPKFADLKAVHRLDRDTTGCLLCARHAAAFREAVALFRQGAVRKMYHCIVEGALRSPARTLRAPIERQRAVTHIRTLRASRQASHLQARLETGRTHQIRKHLAAIGHPVIGDRRYATRPRATPAALSAQRQMLHAAAIEFRHPRTGRPVRAHAPLPADFRRCLKALRLE